MTERLSSTKITTFFMDCEFKYYLQYVEKISVVSDSKYLFIGSEVHRIIADFYKSANIDEIKNNKEVYDRYLRSELSKSTSKITSYNTEIKDNISGFMWFEKERMKEYTSIYGDDFSDFLPKWIEKYVSYENLIGYIDIIFKIGDNYVLYDWKTSNSIENKPDYIIQLRIYQYLSDKNNNKIDKVGNIFTKTRKRFEYERFDDNDKFIQDMINDFKNSIQERTTYFSWKKNGKWCKYCQYLDKCGGNDESIVL